MKPAYEVWLEIVRERLLEGDSAVIAVSKAQIVTAAYVERFFQPAQNSLNQIQQQKYEEPISALSGSYSAGDPNAR